MICEAIQDTIAAIVTNTFPIIGDEETEAPFCLHTETEQEPSLLKEGEESYNFLVEIFIADKLPDSVETNAALIRTAIEGLKGTTVRSVFFNEVNYEGNDPGFDAESREYANYLRFTVNTKNR